MQICEVWRCVTLKDGTKLGCNGKYFEVHDSDGSTSYSIADFFECIRGHEITSISGDETKEETSLLCIDVESNEHVFNTVEQAIVGLKILRLTQPPKTTGK